MKRLASALLAGTFFAATAGMALAATAPAAAPPAATGTAAPAQPQHKAHPRATAATKRLESNGPEEARMTHALNLLEEKGYGDFRDFKQDGKNFSATVDQSGQSFGVVIDPDNNRITRQG